MKKHWMGTSAFLFLGACGAGDGVVSEPFAAVKGDEESILVDDALIAEEAVLAEEVAEEGVHLGTLEQALGEPACGVSPVDRAVSFSGLTVRFVVSPPYGSAFTLG